jgi:AAA domain
MQVATLATRQAKDRELTTESLRATWRAKGAEVGLDREVIGSRLGHELPGETVLTAQKIERAVTEHVSHFDRRDAIRAVADNLPNGAAASEVEELADAFLASSSVIEIAETPRGPRFTTERIWQLEQKALDTAEGMHRAEEVAAVDPILVCRVLGSRPSLKADQREMVSRLLGDGHGLEIVIGEAGSGKTYAIVATAEGWAAAGSELHVAAPTWRAANVLRAEGLPATTVAGLLGRLDAEAETGRSPLRRNSVLLVDEAGMVDSASLARLIDRADSSGAKLVLVGDPAQLSEVEAGGLFAALARRVETIGLDEVSRHRHDLDREAAKLIRDGHGGEAIERYSREGRVVVAADHELRREAIVSDWWAAKERGEDALMIAKLNSERGHLNARARELMRAEGRLGTDELRVGEQGFAAGDEVITRVNDQRAQIYNRERWRIESVDLESGRLVLAGIDTTRQLGVDSGYLGRVNPSDGAPAIEHGYAATIYQAQGATLDSAFVMADPSTDRQEFYVAASRTREETFFYATPEVGFDRIEFAPAAPPADALEHIARAAGRDGAQAAAHDEALREQLAQLSTPELFARRRELAAEAGAEGRAEQATADLEERLAGSRDRADRLAERREQLGEEPPVWARADRAIYREQASQVAAQEAHNEDAVTQLRAEFAAAAPADYAARAERAVAEHLIAERIARHLAAVRLDPPDYIVADLGERPDGTAERAEWDRAVARIESYREERGIRDRDTALGPQPRDPLARLERERLAKTINETRQQIRLEQTPAVERSVGIEI